MPVACEYRAQVTKMTVPTEIIDKWVETLKMRNDLIKSRLFAKIPDEDAFKTRIAEASHEVWIDFVNPDYPLSDLIKLKHKVKLARAYPRWHSEVDKVFTKDPETGVSEFMQRVERKKDRLEALAYTLGGVGIRYLGWNPITKAVLLITGDKRVVRYIDTTVEQFTGSPISVFPDSEVKFARARLIGQLLQGAVLCLYAIEANLLSDAQTIASEINSATDAYITAMKKAEIANAYVHLEVNTSEKRLYVHAYVETA